jgi:hypothetical protein
MKRVLMIAAAALAPVLAHGATSTALLARIPDVPASAGAAYAQWIDKDGDLEEGAQFQSLDAEFQKALTAGLPVQGPTSQMQAAGPVSQSDSALAKQVQLYPATVQAMQKTIALRRQSAALQAQWDKDAAALDAAADTERGRLAICKGEAGQPSSLALKTVALKYAARKIALADSYLPKLAGLAAQFRQTVAPEIAFGDTAVAAWSRIGNPGLKSQTTMLARGAQSSAVTDAARLLTFVEDISKKAADAVAARKLVERADAKGC